MKITWEELSLLNSKFIVWARNPTALKPQISPHYLNRKLHPSSQKFGIQFAPQCKVRFGSVQHDLCGFVSYRSTITVPSCRSTRSAPPSATPPVSPTLAPSSPSTSVDALTAEDCADETLITLPSSSSWPALVRFLVGSSRFWNSLGLILAALS